MNTLVEIECDNLIRELKDKLDTEFVSLEKDVISIKWNTEIVQSSSCVNINFCVPEQSVELVFICVDKNEKSSTHTHIVSLDLSVVIERKMTGEIAPFRIDLNENVCYF